MTDLIERYQETIRDLEEPSLQVVGNGTIASAIVNDNTFRILNANGNIIMEVTADGSIHFHGNLVVHGDLTVDGDVRAARVYNAVFN